MRHLSLGNISRSAQMLQLTEDRAIQQIASLDFHGQKLR